MSKGISWGPGFQREPFKNALGPTQHLHLILEGIGGITSTGRKAGEAHGSVGGLGWPSDL